MNEMEKKLEKFSWVLDEATEKIVREGVRLDLDFIKIVECTVSIPYAILFSMARPGQEKPLAAQTTKFVQATAEKIGEAAAEAGAKGEFNPKKEPELYDGPLKAENVPAEIRRKLSEFFEETKGS